MQIARPVGQEESLQWAELLVINVLAQAPCIAMAEDAVVAVDGGEHALKKSRRGYAWLDQRLVVGQPALPVSGGWGWRGDGGVAVVSAEDQQPEPGESGVERAYAALARESVIGVNNAAQKVNALVAALQYSLVRVQLKLKSLQKKFFDPCFPDQQCLWIVGQQYKVVHIAEIGTRLEGMFDELVQLIEVHVGKKLAGQASYGHAFAGRGVVKGFMAWYQRNQTGPAAMRGRWVNGVLSEDGGGNLVQHTPRDGWVRQPGQGVAPKPQQQDAVNGGEKRLDVHLAIPPVAGLAHEVLQAHYGRLCSFAFSVGVTVINEPAVPPELDMAHKPLLHQPVGKGRRKNLTQLGVCHRKNSKRLGCVAPLGDGACLLKHQSRQSDKVAALVFAVSSCGGALEELPGDVSFCHGV